MLENIKTSFFSKILFSYINEKKKLDIVKYNKTIQNNLEITLVNYKEYSGRYIIYENKRKGKIYDAYQDILLYEGEILNGKKNGKGKEYELEYDYSYLIYEGEFLNGERKGKENFDDELFIGKRYLWKKKDGYYEFKEGIVYQYDTYGNLLFEGEYLNGKRNGKCKEYNEKGKLLFEGEYLYDYKLRGKEYVNDKLIYEGEYLFNKKWNGTGYDENGNILYELNQGCGKVTMREYNKYGIEYEGGYANGKRNGKGKEYHANGRLEFEGEFLNGKRNGKGISYFFDGKVNTEGEYLNDKLNGDVKRYNPENGILIFEGKYLNGKRNGKGKEYYRDGKLEFEGEFLNGERNGKGKEYDFDGNLIFEGEYLNGERALK